MGCRALGVGCRVSGVGWRPFGRDIDAEAAEARDHPPLIARSCSPGCADIIEKIENNVIIREEIVVSCGYTASKCY